MDYYGRNLCRFLKGLGVISGDQKEIFLSRGKTTGTALDLVSDKKVDVTPFSYDPIFFCQYIFFCQPMLPH